jgi:dephospho-CoA kinase
MAFVIGVTGGIGCGKTRATDMFAALGAEIIDTDAISHALTGPGGGAMPAIRDAFGPAFNNADGSLNRARMRELVFQDATAKTRLEQILHPRIQAEVQARVRHSQAPYVMIVVPLLLERNSYAALIQRVLVIDCDEATQIARVMQRSQLSEDQVRAIMRNQMPRAERLSRADDVLENTGSLAALEQAVARLHRFYLQQAQQRPA